MSSAPSASSALALALAGSCVRTTTRVKVVGCRARNALVIYDPAVGETKVINDMTGEGGNDFHLGKEKKLTCRLCRP